MVAAHLTTAADHRGLPTILSRLDGSQATSTTVCCALDIEFGPKRVGRGSFFRARSSHGNSRRFAPTAGRVRLTLQESVNFCSCASSTCAIDSKSHRIASGTWTRQLVRMGSIRRAWVDQKISLCLRLARLRHDHARGEHEGASCGHRSSMRGRATEYTLTGQHSPCQLVSHSPTYWITQEALSKMIDATDTDMNARVVTPSS